MGIGALTSVAERRLEHLTMLAGGKPKNLDTVMAAEGDVVQATDAIDKLTAAACTRTGLVIKLSSRAKPPQLKSLERELSESQAVASLKGRNRIFGEPLTLDEFLDPIEEQENLDTDAVVFEDNMAIIAEVHRRFGTVILLRWTRMTTTMAIAHQLLQR